MQVALRCEDACRHQEEHSRQGQAELLTKDGQPDA
jgi:hypothetical protein